MAIETHEREINGDVYLVSQMAAMRAIGMQARLVKLLGPAFSTIFVAASEDPTTADRSIPQALMILSSQLDEKTFQQLVLDLTQGVRKNGIELTKPIIDIEFSGKLNTLFLVLQFILEVNYSDFFQEGGIIKALLPPIKEEKAPTELKET